MWLHFTYDFKYFLSGWKIETWQFPMLKWCGKVWKALTSSKFFSVWEKNLVSSTLVLSMRGAWEAQCTWVELWQDLGCLKLSFLTEKKYIFLPHLSNHWPKWNLFNLLQGSAWQESDFLDLFPLGTKMVLWNPGSTHWL